MFYFILTIALSWVTLTVCRKLDNRIINGTDASGDNPWISRMITKYEKTDDGKIRISSNCGGSLIAPHWVLTARHCVFDDDNNPSSEQFRISAGNVDYVRGQIVAVTEVHVFNENDNSDDIAMMKLERDINDIEPIPIQLEDNIDYGEKEADIWGWGQTESERNTRKLKTTTVILYDRDNCPNNQVCFNPQKTKSNACSGDSGGPMVLSVDGERRLIGIARAVQVVRGVACVGDKAFYTSTSFYADWIKQRLEQ